MKHSNQHNSSQSNRVQYNQKKAGL